MLRSVRYSVLELLDKMFHTEYLELMAAENRKKTSGVHFSREGVCFPL